MHDYFLLKQKMRDKDRDKHVKDGKYTKKEGESVTGNNYKTSRVSERVYLQIVPEKAMKNNGEKISTFALLDNGRQSTLIRDDFAKQLKLKDYSKV